MGRRVRGKREWGEGVFFVAREGEGEKESWEERACKRGEGERKRYNILPPLLLATAPRLLGQWQAKEPGEPFVGQ